MRLPWESLEDDEKHSLFQARRHFPKLIGIIRRIESLFVEKDAVLADAVGGIDDADDSVRIDEL